MRVRSCKRAYKSGGEQSKPANQEMPAPRPTHQFRFVEARTTGKPGLNQGVKYIAVYKLDGGKTAVLAQGKDKFTLKRWAELLRVKQESLAAVDDMKQALEHARKQVNNGSAQHCLVGLELTVVTGTDRTASRSRGRSRSSAPHPGRKSQYVRVRQTRRRSRARARPRARRSQRGRRPR